MATEAYVCRKVEELINVFDLTINSTEEEIKGAVEAAHGKGDYRGFTREIAPGITVTQTGQRAIFPEWVKMPNGENGEWINDHRWGEGSNESIDTLVYFTKQALVGNAGIDMWRVGWETVQQHSPEKIREMMSLLKETESGRGLGSPYTQDYATEIGLAFEYGAEFLVACHRSMHFKAYADFVRNLKEVTDKFGKTEVMYALRQFPEDYKDICYFFDFVREHSGERKNLTDMYRLWKWTRWVHASSKIETSEIMFLVDKFSKSAISKILDAKKEEIADFMEDLRRFAIYSWLSGDSAEWVKTANKEEAELTVGMADLMGVKASIANSYIKTIMMAGLTVGQIQNTIYKNYYNTEGMPCWDLLQICQKFRGEIISAPAESRRQAVIVLYKNPETNTCWWPQAINENEFSCGLLAEEAGREGLEGIQRTRWLQERLGLNWVGSVDKKLSWEQSCEIIKNNPWLKTAQYFINKEDVILQIAAGEDLAYLRYCADRNEYDLAKSTSSLQKAQKKIRTSWSEDIRAWFNQLAGEVGEELAWNYIGNRSRHDQLFFVGNMLDKLSIVQLKCILLQVRHDFSRFSQAVNAYVPCEEGQKIQSFKEFVKFVELQKNQIVFSTDTPQAFRDKVMEMLEAPGVDVLKVKNFYSDKSNWPFIVGQEDASAVFVPRKEEFFTESLERLVAKALGSRRQKSQPMAENAGLLFKKLTTLAKSAGLKSAVDLVKKVPRKIKEQVIALLREHKTPMGDVFTAEVLPKSDPRGWVIGDWTNCCMQFGTEKNNEYMKRRDMAYFIISLNDRPIAQSVVVAAAHQSRNGSTPTVEVAKIDNIDAIALDNIEVSHNFTRYNDVINRCYREFWDHYGNGHHVIVGTSYNDTIPSNKMISMNWKPLDKMVWSDCFGKSQCYLLHKPELKKQTKEAKNEIHRAA